MTSRRLERAGRILHEARSALIESAACLESSRFLTLDERTKFMRAARSVIIENAARRVWLTGPLATVFVAVSATLFVGVIPISLASAPPYFGFAYPVAELTACFAGTIGAVLFCRYKDSVPVAVRNVVTLTVFAVILISIWAPDKWIAQPERSVIEDTSVVAAYDSFFFLSLFRPVEAFIIYVLWSRFGKRSRLPLQPTTRVSYSIIHLVTEIEQARAPWRYPAARSEIMEKFSGAVRYLARRIQYETRSVGSSPIEQKLVVSRCSRMATLIREKQERVADVFDSSGFDRLCLELVAVAAQVSDGDWSSAMPYDQLTIRAWRTVALKRFVRVSPFIVAAALAFIPGVSSDIAPVGFLLAVAVSVLGGDSSNMATLADAFKP